MADPLFVEYIFKQNLQVVYDVLLENKVIDFAVHFYELFECHQIRFHEYLLDDFGSQGDFVDVQHDFEPFPEAPHLVLRVFE